MRKFVFLLTMLSFFNLKASETFHLEHVQVHSEQESFIWEKKELSPFNELIFSWDAQRPQQGYYLIKVSLLIMNMDRAGWSPWLNYAYWGAQDQYTFKEGFAEAFFQTNQDSVETTEGKRAIGFKIQIQAKEGAALQPLRALHVCLSDTKQQEESRCKRALDDSMNLKLKVKGLSQIAIPDERNWRICSPTSTTAVIRYLSSLPHSPPLPSSSASSLPPLVFAESVRDSAFDIYGNWILNTAQASHLLGSPWHVYVARLNGFHEILDHLQKGYPVVVSIRGPLPGSALPYDSGHLIVVKGYRAKEREVLCMDPAFPSDDSTEVSYLLEDFLMAWNRRGRMAYLFYRDLLI